MPLKKAYKMINDLKGRINVSEFSIKSARRISRLVYKNFPGLDVDQTSGLSIDYSNKHNCIFIEFWNSYCVFEFYCKESSLIFTQWVRGTNDLYDDTETAQDLTDKEIIARIKRRRAPRKKPTQAA